MYDRRLTLDAIDRYNAGAFAAGQAQLRGYAPREVDAIIAHLADAWDPERREIRRALSAEETAFIHNERVLCALDFLYWCDRYVWIIGFHGKPLRFTPNISQRIVLDLWAAREREGLAIWMQQLKARRLGVSTISEIAIQHRFQFQPHAECVIASSTPDKSWKLAEMIKYCLAQQPWWLLPEGKAIIEQGMPVGFPSIGSNLTIAAGNQYTGVGRGATPTCLHLSELMEFEDPESLIDAALMRAIVDTPTTFGILESTGGTLGGWWHRTWEQTKRDFARGRSRMIPVFLPWYVGTDLYPSAADLRARPVPSDWQPEDRTIEHAERARRYVLGNPLLFEHLAKFDRDWRMSREQMWFREMEYTTAKEKKQLHIFRQELCADDFESFQSSNIPIIDPEILITYQERVRDPIGCYTIVGPEIHDSFVIPRRYWRSDVEPVVVRCHLAVPNCSYIYQLIPVSFEGYSGLDPDLRLLVWENPTHGETYGIGLDCGEGIRQDNTVIEVLREATAYAPPAQVAEWISGQTTAFQAWPMALAVACWYSLYSEKIGAVKQARLAIESFTNGASAQNEIQKRGWGNFHPWKYNDTRRPRSDAETQRIGIYTNQWFRASMQDMLLTCLSEEAIDLPSPYLIQELVTLERDPKKSMKAVAAAGAHDDRFMAIGFPLFSLHQNKPPAQQFPRQKVAYVPGIPGEPVTHPQWAPPAQMIAGAWDGRASAQLLLPENLRRTQGALGRMPMAETVSRNARGRRG